MDLTRLSGSPVPNVAAIGTLIILTLATFLLRHRIVGGVCVVLTVDFVTTVMIKNWAYSMLISGPHAENSTAAHHNYARILGYLGWVQLIVVVTLVILSFVLGRLGWLVSFVSFVCVYAEVCWDDWRNAYATQDASRPVHYEMVHPAIHWAFLVGMVLTAVIGVVAPTRRPKPTATRQI